MSARTFVVGDIHGHRKELVAALRANRLVDGDGHWSGGTDTVWFLGDFLDRGPEGIGVIDEVVSLSEQAAEAGGGVHALLGNHEILALGMHRFGETEVPSEFGPRSFARSWQLNGGVGADQEQLTDKRVDWLLKLPVLAVVDDHLLMHSDTVEYLNWGSSVDEINETFAAILASDDISAWWDCWRRMTTRYAFRGIRGGELAGQVLELLGGHQIVHGHSVIAEHLGVLPSQIEAPDLYADGTVLGVDAGLFAGGPCLIVELPYSAESPRRASA
jgi:hypothetical protein